MAEEYIMSIDQGTTSSRAIIVNRQGEIIASDQAEFEQIYPKAGWVEHNPNQIWNNVQRVIAGAFIDGGINPAQIQAIGITNQRETTVVWEKDTGRPIYNAIVWQSRQTADIANKLIEDGHGDMIQQKTGLVPDAYFSATKIRWILDHVDGAQERAENGELLFGTIDSWVLWKLTGGEAHYTDYSNASRTMLLNLEKLDWDDEILELMNIPKVMLPELKSNSEEYAKTKSYHFFNNEVPITAMIGDQQSALVGQLGFEKGMVKSTYGTGAFILMNMKDDLKISENNLLTTVGYVIDDEVNYILEGSIFVAGSAIQWLRDGLELFKESPETEEMANNSNNENEIYIVPAFTGLGAPYWNSDARGSIFGITRGTNKDDLAKATLQAIAYQVRDVVDTMELDSGIDIPLLKVDGGAALNGYLMQFQSDILGKEIARAKNLETTALGAAYMAGLAVGFWKDKDELTELVGATDDFNPKMNEEQKEFLYRGWKRAVDATEYYAKLIKEDGDTEAIAESEGAE